MTVIRPTTGAQVLTQCVVFSRDLPIVELSVRQLCFKTNFPNKNTFQNFQNCQNTTYCPLTSFSNIVPISEVENFANEKYLKRRLKRFVGCPLRMNCAHNQRYRATQHNKVGFGPSCSHPHPGRGRRHSASISHN